jgi:hypothetical protein
MYNVDKIVYYFNHMGYVSHDCMSNVGESEAYKDLRGKMGD